jgi:hypothetical protein
MTRQRRGDLEKLGEVTGARAHFPTNAMPRGDAGDCWRVSHQYSVGYYPNNNKNDGKWRRVQAVAGQRDGRTKYVARMRAGYYARKAEEVKEP